MVSKPRLRQQVRDRRRQWSAEASRHHSQALVARLQAWARWPALRTVFLYRALPGEPDVSGLCTDPHKTWVLPRCVGDRLVWHVWPVGAPLQPGRFGLEEPDPAWPTLPIAAADAILVPALLGDRQGHRLGWGGGFYDRALPAATGWRIGVLFAEFVVESLPVDPWDVPLDAIVTERDWLSFRTDI